MMDVPGFREGVCAVPGASLYYQTAGSGPALVFVHAGIADQRMWDGQFAAFAADFQVVRYDCRGFGRTVTEDVPFSNRADLIALLDQLGIAQAALVGCSRGAMIALDTAIEYADRVTKLVWVCGGIGGWEMPEESYPPAEIELFKAMGAAEQSGDWERTASMDVRLWVDGPLQPEGRAAASVREAVYAMALNTYTTVKVYGQVQPMQPPAAERLDTLRLPILAIVGDLDTVETAAAAQVLAAQAGTVRVVHFSDSAHLPSMEQPEQFNQVLREFL
ncbi:MAG: alpha/beta fold hydrolase [Oscillochloris sp.]|nr:alpha/beta fold hydrolase [Oscillochloris sp.]